MPFTALAIGAAAGLIKAQMVDAPKEEAQRKLAASTIAYSPWTHASVEGAQAQIHPADPIGTAMQGGVAGAQIGQSMQNGQDFHKWMAKGYSPYGSQSGSYGPGPGMFNQGASGVMDSYNSPYYGKIGG